MNSKTRQISEGAMMLALIGVFLFLNRQTANVLEGAVYWILSFPMMLYSAKYGFKTSLVPFVSCMLMSIIIATPTTMLYLLSALSSGIVYGHGVKQGWKNKSLLLSTLLIELLTLFITVILLSSVFGFDLLREVGEIQKTLTQAGLNGKNEDLTMMILILVYVGTSVMQTVIIHVFGHQLLSRFKVKVQPLKSIFEIQLPKHLAIVMGVVFLLNFATQMNIFSKDVTMYILILYFLFFIIGIIDGALSFLCILVKEKKTKYAVFILLACFIPVVNNVVYVFGLYDIYTGFRKSLERG